MPAPVLSVPSVSEIKATADHSHKFRFEGAALTVPGLPQLWSFASSPHAGGAA